MDIIFATSSKGKFQFAKHFLKGSSINLIYKNMNFEEPQDIDVRKIVRLKALQAYRKFKKPIIVQDSGVYIEALKGFPGSQTKMVLQTLGLGNILKMMKGVENRNMYFSSAVAFVDGKGKIRVFYGEYTGKMAEKPRGNKIRDWSELLKIYIPVGHAKTPAEMNEKEWNSYKDSFKSIDPFCKFLTWFRMRR